MISKNKKILHLGCGFNKRPGSIGVDINKKSDADIIHDLNKFPYPFKSNYFDLVIAEHLMEHLDNIPKVLEEVYRTCKNKAKIIITSSHFTSVDSFTDPTHKHFFTSRTFDYFIPGTDLYKYAYSFTKFKKNKVSVGPANSKNPFVKIALQLINKNLIFYEKHLAYIFPAGFIKYELMVQKENDVKGRN